jgi:hypothetical protein
MHDLCIVRECSAEARHNIRTSKKPGVTFCACTYHASGVFVRVSDLFGGKVSLSTSFQLSKVGHLAIGSQQGQHELAS